ncbi:ELKS/Rab6-interacting/CAST family member 1-like [Aricia agestis]|uniref:ELKS/Rab6-interacting/CAST family member 1-like n=1 Tax=Aricia agestis TaxID=91739 RepID=UPI001C20247B|nr:ELKS/Rab6-interacting/CAST family member 1-like [Aricia agestis]
MKVIDLEIELNESSLILSEILKISDGQDLNTIKKSKSFFELQKSGKVVDRLDKCRFSKSYNDINSLYGDRNIQANLNKLTRKVCNLTKEIEIKNSKIIEQQRCISILEDALRDNNNIAEFEQLLAVIRSKDERINDLERIINNKSGAISKIFKDKRILELEDALKESFLIAAEREKVFYEEEQQRIEALQKMKKMEQRLLSLQNASIMNCETCSTTLQRLKQVEESLNASETSREAILKHLSFSIQDLLEKAISEKDSQIAELEVKGVLTETETNSCDNLKKEKDKLLERLKIENELIIKFEKGLNECILQEGDVIPLTLADELLAADGNDDIVWEEDIPATVL